MITEIILTSIILAQFIFIFFMFHTNHKKEQDLLNRIMSKNYGEYYVGEVNKKPEQKTEEVTIDPIQDLENQANDVLSSIQGINL